MHQLGTCHHNSNLQLFFFRSSRLPSSNLACCLSCHGVLHFTFSFFPYVAFLHGNRSQLKSSAWLCKYLTPWGYTPHLTAKTNFLTNETFFFVRASAGGTASSPLSIYKTVLGASTNMAGRVWSISPDLYTTNYD